MLDGRPIRVDYDWGFKDGRQYGRGRSGGQVGSFPALCPFLIRVSTHSLSHILSERAHAPASLFIECRSRTSFRLRVITAFYNMWFHVSPTPLGPPTCQVRDEHRKTFDEGRGGYGKAVAAEGAFQGAGNKRGRDDGDDDYGGKRRREN